MTTRRERLSLVVSEVRSDRFLGVTVEPHRKETRPAGEAVEVPYEDLALLEVTRFDKHNVALVAALVTVSAFAVVAAPVNVVGFPPVLPAP